MNRHPVGCDPADFAKFPSSSNTQQQTSPLPHHVQSDPHPTSFHPNANNTIVANTMRKNKKIDQKIANINGLEEILDEIRCAIPQRNKAADGRNTFMAASCRLAYCFVQHVEDDQHIMLGEAIMAVRLREENRRARRREQQQRREREKEKLLQAKRRRRQQRISTHSPVRLSSSDRRFNQIRGSLGTGTVRNKVRGGKGLRDDTDRYGHRQSVSPIRRSRDGVGANFGGGTSRGRGRDRKWDGDRIRNRDMERDRDIYNERDRYRVRDRDRDRVKDRDRIGDREWERRRGRDRGRDRVRRRSRSPSPLYQSPNRSLSPRPLSPTEKDFKGLHRSLSPTTASFSRSSLPPSKLHDSTQHRYQDTRSNYLPVAGRRDSDPISYQRKQRRPTPPPRSRVQAQQLDRQQQLRQLQLEYPNMHGKGGSRRKEVLTTQSPPSPASIPHPIIISDIEKKSSQFSSPDRQEKDQVYQRDQQRDQQKQQIISSADHDFNGSSSGGVDNYSGAVENFSLSRKARVTEPVRRKTPPSPLSSVRHSSEYLEASSEGERNNNNRTKIDDDNNDNDVVEQPGRRRIKRTLQRVDEYNDERVGDEEEMWDSRRLRKSTLQPGVLNEDLVLKRSNHDCYDDALMVDYGRKMRTGSVKRLHNGDKKGDDALRKEVIDVDVEMDADVENEDDDSAKSEEWSDDDDELKMCLPVIQPQPYVGFRCLVSDFCSLTPLIEEDDDGTSTEEERKLKSRVRYRGTTATDYEDDEIEIGDSAFATRHGQQELMKRPRPSQEHIVRAYKRRLVMDVCMVWVKESKGKEIPGGDGMVVSKDVLIRENLSVDKYLHTQTSERIHLAKAYNIVPFHKEDILESVEQEKRYDLLQQRNQVRSAKTYLRKSGVTIPTRPRRQRNGGMMNGMKQQSSKHGDHSTSRENTVLNDGRVQQPQENVVVNTNGSEVGGKPNGMKMTNSNGDSRNGMIHADNRGQVNMETPYVSGSGDQAVHHVTNNVTGGLGIGNVEQRNVIENKLRVDVMGVNNLTCVHVVPPTHSDGEGQVRAAAGMQLYGSTGGQGPQRSNGILHQKGDVTVNRTAAVAAKTVHTGAMPHGVGMTENALMVTKPQSTVSDEIRKHQQYNIIHIDGVLNEKRTQEHQQQHSNHQPQPQQQQPLPRQQGKHVQSPTHGEESGEKSYDDVIDVTDGYQNTSNISEQQQDQLSLAENMHVNNIHLGENVSLVDNRILNSTNVSAVPTIVTDSNIGNDINDVSNMGGMEIPSISSLDNILGLSDSNGNISINVNDVMLPSILSMKPSIDPLVSEKF